MRVKNYLDRKEIKKENLKKLYDLVMGQCNASLYSTLKGDKDFLTKSKDFGVIWLLEMIKITVGVNTKAKLALTFHDKMLYFLG